MLVEQILLRGVVVPALLAAAVHLVSRYVLRTDRRGEAQRDVVGSTALALAYLAAHVGITGWPPLPAVESTDWLFHAVAVAALATPALVALGERPALVGGFRLFLFGGWLWLSLQSVIEYRWTPLQSVLGIAGLLALLLGLAWAFERLAEERAPHLSAVVGVMAFGAAALVLGLSASARLGQLAGAASVAVAVGWALWPLTRQPPLAKIVATLATLVLGGLLLNGYFYAELRWWNALLVMAAPLVALVAGRRASREKKSFLIAVAAAVLPLALAVGMAGWQASQLPEDPYGDYYG